MEIRISKLALVVLAVVIAVCSIGVMAIDQPTNTEHLEFEAGTPNATYDLQKAGLNTQNTTEVTAEQRVEDNCQTELKTKDSDKDSVNDFVECSYGLNQTHPDTDGDTLTDAEELHGVTEHGTPIPDSNPRQMDVYVVIGISEGAELNEDRLASLFANFNVTNHDGTTGINLHYDIQQLNETVPIGNFSGNEETYQSELTSDAEVYKALLITTGESDEYAGRARIYGNFAVSENNREAVAAHELLHLIVGSVPDNNCEGEFHTCDGETLLSPMANGSEQLSQRVITHIETTGLGPRRTTPGIRYYEND